VDGPGRRTIKSPAAGVAFGLVSVVSAGILKELSDFQGLAAYLHKQYFAEVADDLDMVEPSRISH